MVCAVSRPIRRSSSDRYRTTRNELLPAIRRAVEKELADVPPELRPVLVRRAVDEALFVLAKLDAVGTCGSLYPLPMLRAGVARRDPSDV